MMEGSVVVRSVVLVALLAVAAFGTPLHASAQDAPQPTIAPAVEGDTAVKGGTEGEDIEVAGTAPAGSTIQSARLVPVGGSNPPAQNIGRINQGPGGGDYLRVTSDGTLEGLLTLDCRFANPAMATGCPFPGPVFEVYLEVVIAGTAGQSNHLAIDYTRPVFVRYDVISPTAIVAVISEPVRIPAGGLLPPSESSFDWQVEGNTVTDVRPRTNDCGDGRSGCTRVLELATALSEDAQPLVRYEPGPNRPQYRDYASNEIIAGTEHASHSRAIDNVRPPIPTIESIDGKAPSASDAGHEVRSNQPAPAVALSNLTAGHELLVHVDGAQRGDPIPVQAGEQTIQLPDLGPEQRAYRVEVVARDPNGNLSTDAAKSPSRSEPDPRNPTDYVLDTVRPTVASAVRDGGSAVLVTFTEPTPSGQAQRGTWTLVAPGFEEQVSAADVSGEPAQRRLSCDCTLPDVGLAVRWIGSDDSRYSDLAGNTMADVDPPIAVTDIASLLPPIVDLPPSGESYTNRQLEGDQRVIAAAGTAQGADFVDLYLSDAADAARAASVPVNAGAWATDLEVGSDGSYTVYAVARNTATGQTSGRPGVARGPVHVDTEEPDVRVSEPSLEGGTVLTPGSPREYAVGDHIPVMWTAEDPAPGGRDHGRSAAVAIIFDGDDSTARAARLPSGQRATYSPGEAVTVQHIVADADFNGLNEREARFRVLVDDRATNVGEALSAPVRLLRNFLGYAATLERNAGLLNGGAIVEVRFPEALTGDTDALDWSVDGRRPLRADKSNEDGITVVRLEFLEGFPSDAPDPNFATGLIEYTGTRLRGPGDRRVAAGTRLVRDGIEPVLAVDGAPEGTIRLPTVTFTGRTDTTAWPNTVSAFRADPRTGLAVGDAVAGPVLAGEDGRFSIDVPLPGSGTFAFTFLAWDPSGNSSVPDPSDVRSVTVDLEVPAPPSLQWLNPVGGGLIGVEADLAWSSAANDSGVVTIEWRPAGGDAWEVVAANEPDDGLHRWTVAPTQPDGSRIDLRVRATDAEGFGEDVAADVEIDRGVPSITGARSTSIDSVELTFSEPVSAEGGRFSIVNGPGVRQVQELDEDRVLLELNGDLPTTRPRVRHSGGVKDEAGNEVPDGEIVAEPGFVFPPTGLVAQETRSGVLLSWVDDRNRADDVVRYELLRGGEVLETVDPAGRTARDADVPPPGEHTYAVRVHDRFGHTADASTVLRVGSAAPPDDLGGEAGTGAPPGSEVLDDCGFPSAPNITSTGGAVLSCDGRVAVLVPPGAVAVDTFAKLVQRTNVATPGFAPVMDAYQLVAVNAAESAVRQDGAAFAPVEVFDRYVEVSMRPGAAELDLVERTRLAGLRPRADGAIDELAARPGEGSSATHVLTPGTFTLAQAAGASVRVYGPDPAIPPDRYATAAALSQTSFAEAGEAVIARSDDYPDALAASALAADVGGPVLLAGPAEVPATTELELARLQVERVHLVGGTAALDDGVAERFRSLGYEVVRTAGPTRYHTAIEVARTIGSFEGEAFLATGTGFADALSASSPSATLGRPIFLTDPAALPTETLQGLVDIGATFVTIIGGPVAISEDVELALGAAGVEVTRIGGADRYATAVALADAMVAEDLFEATAPILASGEGDGRTSPDALAAGPVGARRSSPVLLVGETVLPPVVADHLGAAAALRGLAVAGGSEAIADEVRVAVDAAAG